MIRLLHVGLHQPDFQTGRAVEQLTAGLGAGFFSHVRTIGAGGDWGNIARAAIGLRKQAKSCDIVHAWGFAALSAIAFAPFEQIVFTPTQFPRRRQIKWLAAVMAYRNVQVVCPTSTLQRELLTRGVPAGRCHLVRPGVDFARIKRRRDPALRAALGLAEEHQVLLAVGESTPDSDHWHGVWASAILNVLDRNTRLLLWGRGPAVKQTADFAARLHQPELAIVVEQTLGHQVQYEELFAAADMSLISARGPVSTLPIAVAMAAALPTVAAVTPTVAELLEDRHTALMTQPAAPRLLAQRILQMRSDARLQWSLADMARTEAYEYFSLTRFLQQMRELYEQVSAGRDVEVLEQAPGAGLRFHGR
jgi:glycosyltransferase involved in cell wall biosynthesis